MCQPWRTDSCHAPPEQSRFTEAGKLAEESLVVALVYAHAAIYCQRSQQIRAGVWRAVLALFAGVDEPQNLDVIPERRHEAPSVTARRLLGRLNTLGGNGDAAISRFVDEARADPGVLRRLRTLLAEDRMSLDRASRSFLAFVGSALLSGAIVLRGAVGAVLVPLIAAPHARRGISSLCHRSSLGCR